MTTYTNDQVLAAANGKENTATIITICPGIGKILVVNSMFTETITAYEKQSNGLYKRDKVISWSEELEKPLLSMLHNHNFTPGYQKEAEEFTKNYPSNIM